MRELRPAQAQVIADAVNQDGLVLAGAALERARGSVDIAIAIMGVAVGALLERADEPQRREMLQRFLDSFDR